MDGWAGDVEAWIEKLKQTRPVFHSEADFQHGLAWTAQTCEPSLRVRLETRSPEGHLDVLFSRPERGQHLALELKYLTAEWSGEVEGESFALKNQGAGDIRSYDVAKDIARVERLCDRAPGVSGAVLVLSNDPGYWRRAEHGRATNADAFRLDEDKVLSGVCAWGPNTGPGTMKGRADPIELRGSHRCAWSDFSRLGGGRGSFRSVRRRNTSSRVGRRRIPPE